MTPTNEQIASIGKIADEFKANCMHFSSYKNVCSISVLYNKETLTDNNLVVVTNTIYKLNQDNQPLTMTKNLLIEPDGSVTDMSDFLTPQEQADTLAKMTKLEMNQ